MSAQTLNLFQDIVVDAPTTEGIKYAGSKLKLLPYILQLVRKVKPRTVLDGFSGTTRVSQALAQTGHRVIANDLSAWSEIFGKCYLLNTYPPEHYQPLVDHLNALPGRDGWFTEHYGGEPNGGCSVSDDGLKKPWQRHNTRRLDAIREEIDRLSLPDVERAVLLASLILALDEVESTLGHFASYLNDWSPRSYNKLHLQVPRLIPSTAEHSVHRGDIFGVLPQVEADLAYFDPPYGSNNEKMPPSRVRYAAYYHIWTTVCLNDKPPVFGKAKRRADTSDTVTCSPFEEFRRGESGHFLAVEAIGRLLREVRAQHIILSYSSGGRATAEELNDVISSVGRVVEVLEVDYRKNVMAGMRWTNEWIAEAEAPNREFLFLIEKS
ncbi:MAG: DNA adenine methylase [Verrucomicrobiae bacterium]|nr:DNA adenine methylase [Verrucomicrobiae bacterium]